MNYNKEKYWIWLSLIKGLGSRKKQMLLEKYKTPENIFKLNKNELLKNRLIGDELSENILNKNLRQVIDKHIEYMIKNNINIINYTQETYPQILRKIHDFPISIYVKGNINILNQKSIGIVGCREASQYGKKSAKYFAYNLAKQNFNIVSGLAKGVDSYAHLGAVCALKEENFPTDNELSTELERKMKKKQLLSTIGKTIGVLGCGLDIIYPQENKKLAEEIIRTGGAIISEYPLGTKPEKMNFPARNRIISGMSNGIIVIEAKEKSGTLITVDFALEQGRDVFAVPGNINSINSVGTNYLIKQGAKVACNYLDVLEEIYASDNNVCRILR